MKKLFFAIATIIILAIPGFTVFASDRSDNGVAITVVMPTVEEQPEPAPVPDIPTLYPVSVSENREHNRREIIRAYELSDHENPDHIPRGPFERDGFFYELAEITRNEMLSFDSREHIETITVNTATKDLETVLKLLAQTLEYQAEDGFIGALTLDVSTITVESAGTRTITSTASRTREYPHLSSNDLSLVPKTVTDSGTTFHLADVGWRAGNTEAIDYTQLPQDYTAMATYTATVSKTSVIGYNTTAEYKGVISKTSQGKMRYTASFIGIPIVMPVATQLSEISSPTDAGSTVVGENNFANEETDIALTEPTLFVGLDDGGMLKETVEAGETENEGNQRFGIPPAIVVILLGLVAAIAYFIGKYGKKVISKLRKPLCLMLAAVMLFSVPQAALASISQLPGYGFGSGTSENTIHFDTSIADRQPVFLGSLDFNYEASYQPRINNDGDLIGKITVQKSGRIVNIYEGESMASMNKGGGRFSFTGMNSGNTGIIGHNRGRTNGFFIFVKDLREGDILTLEMGGVVKNYAVSLLYTVPDTDFTPLMQYGDNRLTLVTCLENQKNMRRIAVAYCEI